MDTSETTSHITEINFDAVNGTTPNLMPSEMYQAKIDFVYCASPQQDIFDCDNILPGVSQSDVNTHYNTIKWLYNHVSESNETGNTISYKTYYPEEYIVILEQEPQESLVGIAPVLICVFASSIIFTACFYGFLQIINNVFAMRFLANR